jgi:hypothetical protein
MFSYQNKVVAIKATRTSGSGAIDVLVNNAYIGSITGTGQGDSAYFIGSDNSSLSLAGVSGNPTGYVYYFSDLLLNVGSNELCSSNEIGSEAISSLEINLYDLSGSTLVNPTRIGPLWSTSYTGTASRWNIANIANGGFELDFKIEANSDCGGSNEDRQIGAVYTDINIPPSGSLSFDYAIASQVEILNPGYDTTSFRISIDNSVLQSETLESTESGGGACSFELKSLSGDFSYTNSGASPSVATIAIDFDTEDGVANKNIGTNLKINNFQTTSDNFQRSSILTGGDICYFFDLQYPAGRTVPLVEVFPVFNVDTGNLNQVFTGSGVHLKKDVTLFFDILDQQLNTVSSNQQFLENPLISGCVFDILNVDGTIASENFFTGKYSRSLAFSALDNENVFGSYRKDFGVRCKLPNTFDGSVFTGEFYAYGNVPNILDIVPDYTEFSGAAQATELINAAIVLQNDLNFTQMDRYDVYALTGSGSAVNELTYLNPFAQEGYLFSQSAADVVNARSLTINRGTLPQDVPHYFTVVPYGTLGSGSSFTFGPATFVTVENIIVFPETNSSALNLYDGNSFGQTVYKTGRFLSDTGILHEFSSGQFSSVKYFIEVSGSGQRRLSELRGVVNTTGFDLTKEPVNDTTTQYQLTGSSSGQCGLFASGSGYTDYSYKLQATMI